MPESSNDYFVRRISKSELSDLPKFKISSFRETRPLAQPMKIFRRSGNGQCSGKTSAFITATFWLGILPKISTRRIFTFATRRTAERRSSKRKTARKSLCITKPKGDVVGFDNFTSSSTPIMIVQKITSFVGCERSTNRMFEVEGEHLKRSAANSQTRRASPFLPIRIDS